MDSRHFDSRTTDSHHTDTHRTDSHRMDRSEASALADLQMHWDEAYAIGLDGDIWSARFHGSADELRAHTSTELRELIRTDYAYRTRADTARGRRETTARGEAGLQPGADVPPEATDADESLGGYGPGALAGYGVADEAAPGRAANPAEAAEQADCAHQRSEGSAFAAIRGERMST